MRILGAGSIRRHTREWVLRAFKEKLYANTPTFPESRQVLRRAALLAKKKEKAK